MDLPLPSSHSVPKAFEYLQAVKDFLNTLDRHVLKNLRLFNTSDRHVLKNLRLFIRSVSIFGASSRGLGACVNSNDRIAQFDRRYPYRMAWEGKSRQLTFAVETSSEKAVQNTGCFVTIHSMKYQADSV